jgi:hypothetical protein
VAIRTPYGDQSDRAPGADSGDRLVSDTSSLAISFLLSGPAPDRSDYDDALTDAPRRANIGIVELPACHQAARPVPGHERVNAAPDIINLDYTTGHSDRRSSFQGLP